MHGQQKAFLTFSFLTSIFLVGTGELRAGAEQLALPFSCRVEGTDVRLTPSGEQTLDIVGPRQERVVLACADGRPVQCRTMIAHKFEVTCGGTRVDWTRVAEAIGGRRDSRVWRDGDQINIALKDADLSAGEPVTAVPCAGVLGDTKSSARRPIERVAMKPCPTRGARDLHFVMPAGYAPVAHFGGRILGRAASLPEQAAKVSPAQERDVAVAAAQPQPGAKVQKRRLLERTILSEPLPDLGPASATRLAGGAESHSGGEAGLTAPSGTTGSIATAPARGSANQAGVSPPLDSAKSDSSTQRVRSAWAATVTPSHSRSAHGADAASRLIASPRVEASSTAQRDVIVWLVLTSLFAMTGWMMWVRQEQVAGLARRFSGRFETRRVPALDKALRRGRSMLRKYVVASPLTSRAATADAIGAAGGYPVSGLDHVFDAVRKVVDGLPGDLPLRSVLEDELRRVRQRLCVAKVSGSSDGAEVPAPAYRVLVRDMERIRRIGVSARDSVVGGGNGAGIALGSGRLPTTRNEALALLGLNPSVNEATVKKCVDALRMSWHPDLAHDAADLALREERMKQINVAVELILGRPRQA